MRPSRRKNLRPIGFIEALECRLAFAADCHNAFNMLDVDDDSLVSPQDALLVINELNSGDTGDLRARETKPTNLVDVDGDDVIAPIDALLVINHLNLNLDDLALVVSLSPDSDPDGNNLVLQPTVVIRGQTSPTSRLRISGARDASLETTADDQGHFAFSLTLAPGLNSFRVAAVDTSNRGMAVEGTVRFGDAILDWNAALLNVVRDWTGLSNDPYPNRIVTSQPPLVARNLAMIHAAMYDAVNSIEQTHQPYKFSVDAPEGASNVAAAAAAAQRVASNLYTRADELAIFDAALAEALATVPDGAGKQAGIDVGRQVGDAMLAWRKDDGASAKVTYTPGTDPGDWQRTFPDFYPPLLPQWPSVMPFAMTSPSQFRPPPPPALDGPEYATAVDELVRLGGADSTERTPEQTDIALFWADGGGTFTPPGHWNQIAADVALSKGSGFADNARLFALLNIAEADAGIACWDAKYFYNLWRPIDAIRKADLDGNPATTADPNWTPLLRTPPFPTYISGHSTFSAAAAVVLSDAFGTDTHFTSEADGHNGFTQRPLNSSQVTTRSFASFSQAADEAARSRLYGGIHFVFDNSMGIATGRDVATSAVDLFRP